MMPSAPELKQPMELTLTFRAELPAVSRSNPRVAEKHRIRQYFHEQLAVHWQENALLREQIRR